MSKQYVHLHTMAKTSVKFQNDWPKPVGEVALTRHPLSIVDERTNVRVTARLCYLRANAGATKKQFESAMVNEPLVFKLLKYNCIYAGIEGQYQNTSEQSK